MMHSRNPCSLTCSMRMLLMLSSFFLAVYSATDTISFIEPLQDPNFIVSSGQTFKLGFFSPENSTNRYLGIMYDIAKSPVVWVANRDSPLTDSSGALTISEEGNLVVLNGKKEILWSSNASSPAPNSTAQLLDDGNFVLTDSSDGRSVWESFQIPTDTFLPGMKIGVVENKTIQLTSWKSLSDPSIGSFSLGTNPLRNTAELVVWNGRGELYWRSGPWDGNILIGVSLPEMGTDYQNRYDRLVNDISAGSEYFIYDYTSTTDLFQYELSYLGNVQGSVFHVKEDWQIQYVTVTSDCDVYGKCGPNGICHPNGSPICSCLKGFEPKDEQEWTKGNWTGGCLRKVLLQCQRNHSSGEKDGFFHLRNVKVPDLYNNIAVSDEKCGSECLNNCSCSAYVFIDGIGCLHWDDNMIDIQQFPKHGSNLSLRLAHSELDNGWSKQKKIVVSASCVVVGCLILAVSSYLLWNWMILHRGRKQEIELSLVKERELSETEIMISDILEKSKLEELPLYGYETLASATDHFNPMNKLGQGGFGPVYKGNLLSGQEIAVKRLSNSSGQGIEEFMNEVIVISKLQHRNLVKILGCCVEREEKMLVYEYMPNKSLDVYLFDSQKQDLLDWSRRCIIIEGIGRGLLYLHRDSRLRIIHRDMKASNILLDIHLNPKISDFGLARIFGGEQDQANTIRVVGTYGYMAPEYAMGGKFSEKSDVYSFGVLLLEIISGKRNSSFYHIEQNQGLLGYAWRLWNENEAARLAFKDKLDPSIETEIQRCVQVGLLCVQDSTDDRPNMSNVLLMLNSDIRELPLPKLPAYTAALALSRSQFYVESGNSVNSASVTDMEGR